MDTTSFLGLDVHKKTIAVATVEGRASADVRYYDTIPNTPEAIRSMLRKLGKGGQRRCDVMARSLIPRKSGDKIKTDRRDAMMLAQLLRAGQLTEVWVPDEAHEAMRDLVRMRAQAMKDLRKTRQQLHSFLLRHARVFPGKHWTKAHRRWLGELKFAHPAQHLVLKELPARIERAEELCDRLKKAVAVNAGTGGRGRAGAQRCVDPGCRDGRGRGR